MIIFQNWYHQLKLMAIFQNWHHQFKLMVVFQKLKTIVICILTSKTVIALTLQAMNAIHLCLCWDYFVSQVPAQCTFVLLVRKTTDVKHL